MVPSTYLVSRRGMPQSLEVVQNQVTELSHPIFDCFAPQLVLLSIVSFSEKTED